MKVIDNNSKKWIKYRKRYDGLIMHQEARTSLDTDSAYFKSFCNGVGSTVGWFNKLIYPLIPNTILLLNITPASDIHDFSYSIPKEFNTIQDALKYKAEVDQNFLSNMEILIVRRGGIFMKARLIRAHAYFFMVKNLGNESFLSDKTIKNNNI